MNIATPLPWPGLAEAKDTRTSFQACFEHAPMAVALCNSEGVIVEMNPVLERSLSFGHGGRRLLRLCELVRPEDRGETDLFLRDIFGAGRSAIGIETIGIGQGQISAKWTVWRQAGSTGESDHALLVAGISDETAGAMSGESLLQARRWEAIGRLAGGVVHDFNNLLTGVMLYCDLLLSSLDGRDCRRRYADEIRSAILQASGLVRQLLVGARPEAAAPGRQSLNEIAEAMRDLLTRLVGDNIVLELRLEPELGAIEIARVQAQQILLNLVLNARDALPDGGRITVETSNCGFRPVAATTLPTLVSSAPCVLLTVGDNGRGMSAETRRRLFEPFFTTKTAAQGSGLGLTTVRGIVTTNHGLIHFESEPGRGTRAMILFPRSAQSAESDPANLHLASAPPTQFQEVKKESLL